MGRGAREGVRGEVPAGEREVAWVCVCGQMPPVVAELCAPPPGGFGAPGYLRECDGAGGSWAYDGRNGSYAYSRGWPPASLPRGWGAGQRYAVEWRSGVVRAEVGIPGRCRVSAVRGAVSRGEGKRSGRGRGPQSGPRFATVSARRKNHLLGQPSEGSEGSRRATDPSARRWGLRLECDGLGRWKASGGTADAARSAAHRAL